VKRPGLPHPTLRRHAAPDLTGASPLDRTRTEEDARILRRTRLRLMAVSGFVTLVILAVLGTAIYSVTANVLAADSTGRLAHVAGDTAYGRGGTSQDRSGYELTFGGDRAGIMPIRISTSGLATWFQPPSETFVGMPDAASAKVALAGQTDVRTAVVTVTIASPSGSVSQQVDVRIYSMPVRDSSGAVIGAVQTCADRSEEVRLLATLMWVLILGGFVALLASLLAGYLYAGRALVPIRQSIDRRQAALQRQREFAANASHELRTPLTVIRASVEDLARNRKSKVQDVGEALEDIEAEVRHMTALVEDMLLLARTDSGVVQVDRVPVDLADVAADVASSLSTLGQERGVAVLLDPLPSPTVGDALRLRQLITILTDNAIRHSLRDSTVTVQVRSEPGYAVVQVDDEGPGIKPDDLPRLFERFWRADDAPAGGTGLGLAIAKWIVDQHGGTIAAENRPEGGARFLVRLPVVNPGAHTPAVGEGPATPPEP